MLIVSCAIMKIDTFAMSIMVGVDRWLSVKRFTERKIESMPVHDDLRADRASRILYTWDAPVVTAVRSKPVFLGYAGWFPC